MEKIKKVLVLIIISITLIAVPCAYALRVPINKEYDQLDRVMLENLSVPELIERIYPDYERYITLLEGFCNNLSKKKEISKADIQEYFRLKEKLSIILNIWNGKVAGLWHSSGERWVVLTDDIGNKKFLEWKDSAMNEWLKRCDKNIRIRFSPIMLRGLFLGPEYIPTNHFDVFVKTGTADQFVFLQHIHANLTMRDLFTLIPLKDAALHMFSGQYSFDRHIKDAYQYYTNTLYYVESVLQIDSNGLFSVPAVDKQIAQIMNMTEPATLPSLRPEESIDKSL